MPLLNVLTLIILMLTSLSVMATEQPEVNEITKYNYPILNNPESELIKKKLVNPQYQNDWVSLLLQNGKACKATVRDWRGTAYTSDVTEIFSISNISLLQGICVDGFVNGVATIKFEFISDLTGQSGSNYQKVDEQGSVILKGQFSNGIVNGNVELFASSTEHWHNISQADESEFIRAKEVFMDSFYVDSMPATNTIRLENSRLLKNVKGSLGKIYENTSFLNEIDFYKNGLINGILIFHSNPTQVGYMTIYPYKDGLKHGFTKVVHYDGFEPSKYVPIYTYCFENDVYSRKTLEECAK